MEHGVIWPNNHAAAGAAPNPASEPTNSTAADSSTKTATKRIKIASSDIEGIMSAASSISTEIRVFGREWISKDRWPWHESRSSWLGNPSHSRKSGRIIWVIAASSLSSSCS